MAESSAFSQLIFGDRENAEIHEDPESDEIDDEPSDLESDSEGRSHPPGKDIQDDN